MNVNGKLHHQKVDVILLFIPILALFLLHGGEKYWQLFLPVLLMQLYFALTIIRTKVAIFRPINAIEFIFGIYFIFLAMDTFVTHKVNLPARLNTLVGPSIELGNLNSIKYLLTVLFCFQLYKRIVAFQIQKKILLINLFITTVVLLCVYSWLLALGLIEFKLFQSYSPWNNVWHSQFLGPFSYKNHFPIVLCCTFFLCCAELLDAYLRKSNKACAYYLLCIAIILLTLVYTESRGATLIFFTMAAVYCMRMRSYIPFNIMALSKVIGVIGITLLIVFSSGIQRAITLGLDDNGRIHSYKLAFDMFKDNPIWGVGSGNYSMLYNLYKTSESSPSAMFQWVHNDYLEVLVTHGIVGFTLFMLLIAALLFKAYPRTIINNARPFSSFIAAICILLHGLIDYSFSLPFILTLLIILLALTTEHPRAMPEPAHRHP